MRDNEYEVPVWSVAVSESYLDMSLSPAVRSEDRLGPRIPAKSVLKIVDPETNFRGKPKTATERLKHHLSVYERVVNDLAPCDVKQAVELSEAIAQDAKDLLVETLAVRSTMVANVLGIDAKVVTPELVTEIAAALSPRSNDEPAALPLHGGRTVSLAAIRRRLEEDRATKASKPEDAPPL